MSEQWKHGIGSRPQCTKNQKRDNEIAKLRQDGMTYKKISELFNLSISRVRDVVLTQKRLERRKSREELTAEAEIEGGGMTWYFVCGECHGALPEHNAVYCPHCKRRIIWT